MAAAILAVIAACVSGLVSLSHDPGHKKSASIRTRFLYLLHITSGIHPYAELQFVYQRRVSHEQLTERFRLTVNAEAIMLVASCGS